MYNTYITWLTVSCQKLKLGENEPSPSELRTSLGEPKR